MTVLKIPKPAERITTKALHKNGLYRVDGNRSCRVVHCLQGVLWITQEGDWRDRILTAGEEYRTRLPGFVLVQALDDSRIEVSSYETVGLNQPIPWLGQRKFNHA